MKHVLDVKATTNTAMVYAETRRYPLAIHIILCIIKFWFNILNSVAHKLIHIIYPHVLQQSYLGEWLSHVKSILCINGFSKVWIDQGVTNQNRFLKAFHERCHDIYAQQCLSEIHDQMQNVQRS